MQPFNSNAASVTELNLERHEVKMGGSELTPPLNI